MSDLASPRRKTDSLLSLRVSDAVRRRKIVVEAEIFKICAVPDRGV